MSDLKQPGQRAYETWRGPRADIFGEWETLLKSEQQAWARVEAVPAEPEQAGKVQGWRDASGEPPEPDTLAWIVCQGVVQHQPWLYEHHHNIGWRWCFEEHRIEANEVSHWLPATPPAPPTKDPTNV